MFFLITVLFLLFPHAIEMGYRGAFDLSVDGSGRYLIKNILVSLGIWLIPILGFCFFYRKKALYHLSMLLITLLFLTPILFFFSYSQLINSDIIEFFIKNPAIVFDNTSLFSDKKYYMSTFVSVIYFQIFSHFTYKKSEKYTHSFSKIKKYAVIPFFIYSAISIHLISTRKFQNINSQTSISSFFQAAKTLSTKKIDFKSHAYALPVRYPSNRAIHVPTDNPKPNVLFIVNETLGAVYMGKPFNQHGWTILPETLKFAEAHGAIFFPQMNSNASCTDMSLPTIFSGIAPTRHTSKLVDSMYPWDVFSKIGYVTFYNSAHNMEWANFRLHFGTSQLAIRGAENHNNTRDDNLGVPDSVPIEWTLNDIASAQDKPWFGVLHLNTTHPPYRTEADTDTYLEGSGQDKYGKQFYRYLNSTNLLDKGLSHFFSEFEKSPAFHNTIIIFTADHGEAFGQHGLISHCGRFYSEESRVPAFISVPTALQKNQEMQNKLRNISDNSEKITFNIDIVPTLFDLLSIQFEQKFDGISLAQKKYADNPVTFSNCSGARLCPIKSFGFFYKGVRFVFDGATDSWKAFVESTDPQQLHDVITSQPAVWWEGYQKIQDHDAILQYRSIAADEKIKSLAGVN